VLDLNTGAAEALVAEIRSNAGEAICLTCDVLDKASIELAAKQVIAFFGHVDILINGAGGNKSQATTSTETPFFDLPQDAMRFVIDLNLMGTVLPSQVFGRMMAEQGSGVILNISSMNAFHPLTRIPAYSAAKAGVSNFTGDSGQRNCPWILPHRAKSFSAHRQKHWCPDIAR
jgi:NAD(P)-dependent dehydrogenase (short-subunit alcohol dehydrogenase family)